VEKKTQRRRRKISWEKRKVDSGDGGGQNYIEKRRGQLKRIDEGDDSGHLNAKEGGGEGLLRKCIFYYRGWPGGKKENDRLRKGGEKKERHNRRKSRDARTWGTRK